MANNNENEFKVGHRNWLIESIKEKGINGYNPFSGKTYRSLLHEYNSCHLNSPIEIQDIEGEK